MRSRHSLYVLVVLAIAAALVMSIPSARAGSRGSGSAASLPSSAVLTTAAQASIASPDVTFTMNDVYGFYASDYGVIPPGTMVQVDVAGTTFDSLGVSLDGVPLPYGSWYSYPNGAGITLYMYDTYWPDGTHLLQVDALSAGEVVASHTFTLYLDSNAVWPLDTVNVNVITVGFSEDPGWIYQNLTSSAWAYTQYTEDPNTFRYVSTPYRFNLVPAAPEYAATLVDRARANATYRTDLEARLNLPALITQRDTGVPQDIFDPLVGYELPSSWLEDYVQANPITPISPASFTFYLVNLDGLNDPATGATHWFVRPVADTDTGRPEDWWRLEWDNALNIPMGYPMNIFGGPDHTVFVDPTAYEWYLDWTNVWWNWANDRAPYGYAYDEVAAGSRPSYLATFVNDLLEGLASEWPYVPILQDNVLIRNYVLDASVTHPASDLSWVVHDAPLLEYLQSFLPFKHWQIETTIEPLDAMPQLESMVDNYTTWYGDHGYVDGDAVWTSLYENKSRYVPAGPDTFPILTVNFVFDDRSMVSGGNEFTGLGGSGITAIFMQTNRLYDFSGQPRRGLTTTIAHETGHNLGYAHQFGYDWQYGYDYMADFVDGGMGYFRDELTYGTFWEDNLYRVYDHMELENLLGRLAAREPLPLADEFRAFYRDYTGLQVRAAYGDLMQIQALLDDPVPPVAEAGADVTTAVGASVTLDAGASTDNMRIASYAWDFGDGRTAAGASPTVDTSWSVPGTYLVTLTVTDVAGNQATDTLTVTVLAPLPPPVATILGAVDAYGVVVPSGGSTVSSGIALSFSADRPEDVASFVCGVDGVWAACTSPAVYADLGVGAHAFVVYALDRSGEIGLPMAVFAWTVLTPAQGTANLLVALQSMGLPSGTTNSLLDPLQKAYQILTDGKPGNDLKACTQLDAFISQVQLYVEKGRLSATQGQRLETAALEIEGALGCT